MYKYNVMDTRQTTFCAFGGYCNRVPKNLLRLPDVGHSSEVERWHLCGSRFVLIVILSV